MAPSVAFFIPALCCILVAAFGIVCVGTAIVGLRMSRRALGGNASEDQKPPVLTKVRRSDGLARNILWWKLLRGAGLVLVSLAIAGLWATGFTLAWNNDPPREWNDGQSPDLEALVRKRCVKFMEKGRSVGLAIAIVQSTNFTVMTFGRQSLGGGALAQGDTLFELGSITKTFTALALAREIERGNWTLETTVQELLPPGVALPDEARGVTLKNLTTHSSGFPRLPGNLSILGSAKMLLFGSDPYEGYDEPKLLAGLQTVKLKFAPGTKSSYSNFGLMLLGYLLGRKAGTSCESVIKEQICKPLGMGETTMQVRTEQRPRAAQGYRALLKLGPIVLGLRSAPWFDSGALGGAGALRSTGNDMLKYLQANMHPDGTLGNAIRASHRELFQENDRMAFGMNWIRSKRKDLKETMIWHNGGTGGFRSFLGFTEDGQIGVVVLSNSAEQVDGLGIALLRDLNGK